MKKKKETEKQQPQKPEPNPCPKCRRSPVVVKTRPCCWRVACPYLDCLHVSAYGVTEDEAIEKWNEDEVIIG